MCGIFAYMGHTPLSILKVLELLQVLESHQEPDEKTPVGGHAAGIFCLNEKSSLTLEKVGKINSSPCHDLTSKLKDKIDSSNLILGHVRRASPEFKGTTQYRVFAQPYKPGCRHNLSIVSAHNGFLQNYQLLRNSLTSQHMFESQKIKLNDSEVLAHLYEELLIETKDTTKAAHLLYERIEGNNTAVIVTINKNQTHINALQKGKTRGIVIWIDPRGDVLICSREKPVQKTLRIFLQKNNYRQIIHITRNDSVSLETHFTGECTKSQ